MDRLNPLSHEIIGYALEIHRALGPGLLESVYRTCLIYELRTHSHVVVEERLLTIPYKTISVDGSYRLDLLVDDILVVELKAVEIILPVHHAQVLSYLRLTNKRLGLLINFNVPVLAQGIKRIINGYGSPSVP